MADNQTPKSGPVSVPDPEKNSPPQRPNGYSTDYQKPQIINNSSIAKTTPFETKTTSIDSKLVLNPNYAEEFLKKIKAQQTTAIPQSSTTIGPSTDTHKAKHHKSPDKTTHTTNRTNSQVIINQSGNVVNGNCEGPLINGNVHGPIVTGGQHTTQNFYNTTSKEKDDVFERRHRYDKKKKQRGDGRDESPTSSSKKRDENGSSDDSSSTI